MTLNQHAHLIDALGGIAAVAAEIGAGDEDYERVKKWRSRGIAHRWRPAIAILARRRSVPLPDGFLPEELLQSIPESQDKTPRRAGEAA